MFIIIALNGIFFFKPHPTDYNGDNVTMSQKRRGSVTHAVSCARADRSDTGASIAAAAFQHPAVAGAVDVPLS